MLYKQEVPGSSPRLPIRRGLDGLAIAVPNAWPSPEMAAEQIRAIRRQVEEKGRDPEAFRIGIWACALMHDDPAQIEAATQNAILRFVTGALGRTETHTWDAEGLPSPVPEGWTCYKDLLPYAMQDDFLQGVIDAVTPEHVRRGFLVGNAEEIATRVKPFIDAGVDWVCAFDYLPIVSDPADAPNAAGRMIDLCGCIRALG